MSCSPAELTSASLLTSSISWIFFVISTCPNYGKLTNTIKDSQQYSEGTSKVRPQQLDDHGKIPEPEHVSYFDDDGNYVTEMTNREEINQWVTERKSLTAHKDGTGDGSSIYLDFSKGYREAIKQFDKKRGYIHVITSHEFRHVKANNNGNNIYEGDGTNRNEKDPTKTHNRTAKELNRFRIRKFKTNVDPYGILNQ